MVSSHAVSDYFALHLHHGGKFDAKTYLYYAGGDTSFYYNVDLDMMSYFELKGMVEELAYTNMRHATVLDDLGLEIVSTLEMHLLRVNKRLLVAGQVTAGANRRLRNCSTRRDDRDDVSRRGIKLRKRQGRE
ncbi:hypothetical protein LguiA_023658 [Lonicera macranthoides]